jgi:IclR helix-turn-helix domain
MVDQNMMINPMTPQRAAVLAVLQQASGPLRLLEVAARTRMKPTNVSALLYRMREDGQAEFVVQGPWRLWRPCTHGGPRRTCLPKDSTISHG